MSADGELRLFDRDRPSNFALVKDHLFVLNEPANVGYRIFTISEYQLMPAMPAPLKDHECCEFSAPPQPRPYSMRMYACEGFLMLNATNGGVSAFEHILIQVYDLSTCEWHSIPPSKRGHDIAMCELRWDAIP